ncbi:MBL fold metallo-hydrolase [Arcicella sp. LKC2W]|uniref:MBL fold metallo-hydrolase n=1 Tax=Arcicella sp. LKC2W TaxID=2984198 RepID=UPI002B2046A2|nr:MBL fold metallo-hydrolase [Arcicella sp. LKC2W]MEA5460363.1 MBL fold metallo-hydrolase [Arcicella sp. LKC2W]
MMKRRKFIKNSMTITAVSAIGGGIVLSQKKQMKQITKNPDLETVWQEWEKNGGNPLDENGLFLNMDTVGYEKAAFSNVFKWKSTKNPFKVRKDNTIQGTKVIKDDSFLNGQEDVVVMLGHATIFIRLAGKRILIDPLLGNVPVPYMEFMASSKRFSEFPIDSKKLINLDYILISHAHYDHCDKTSLKLLQKQNPNAKILTGLRMQSLLQNWMPNHEIQEAGWFQKYKTDNKLDIVFVPSCHWSNRGLNDANETLWGGFVFKTNDKTIYFGGDSGYGNGTHFKKIGELFPNIDLAIIGAGAFAPTWFMKYNHQEPIDTVRAFKDCKAKRLIPFHFGTFDLSDEPLNEPAIILEQLQAENKIGGNELKIVKFGEVVLV